MSSRRLVGASALVLASLGLAACDAGSALPGTSDEPTSSSSPEGEKAAKPPLAINLPRGKAPVPVDKLIKVRTRDARLTTVEVASAAGQLTGTLSRDGATWTADDRLEPGTDYTLRAVATGAEGDPVRRTSKFTTQ
ncbi:MAG: Ig-like domain-containing protein, partial [Nocardioides sp.]|nr:Ig-like domain-containing protein [Nocardioides sp.]